MCRCDKSTSRVMLLTVRLRVASSAHATERAWEKERQQVHDLDGGSPHGRLGLAYYE